MSNKWRSNLQDAVLLDPLVLVHGNCKDVFLVNAEERSRLPAHLQQIPAVTMEVMLALELEAAGMDAVVLYDPVSGLRVMRGSMHKTVQQLLAARTGASPAGPRPSATNSTNPADGPSGSDSPSRSDAAPGAGASGTAGTRPNGPALPRASVEPPPNDAWMVRMDQQYKPIDFLRVVQTQLFANPEVRVGVICQFVDRYLPFSERQDPEDRQLSMVIQKAAMAVWPQAVGPRPSSRLLLLFDVEGQVPQELNTLFPFARSVMVPPPAIEDRENFFRNFHQLFDSGNEAPVDLARDGEQRKLAAQLSDGLKMHDLFSLATLSHREHLGLTAKQLPQLLTRFKFGTRENAWANVSTTALQEAKQRLTVRVKGQSEIIDEIVPVLMRAKLGMTDIAGKANSSKPRGVFFFVGPTGVGKTELSKAIAELIFGDENSLLRFDMSEYSEEHQQARLVGAPPGYVGFDQGGQLTNAISEKPFSVVLFDEIEKAHGRILDKFLQILDDGRLTDGMGKTVYFTESIIIFTSNLGTRRPVARNPDGSAALQAPQAQQPGGTADTYDYLRALPYEELCDHFRGAVKHFFVEVLGRPEILNRIGEENILVFHFLTDDGAKTEIIDQQVQNMQSTLQEQHRVSILCTPAFKKLLMAHPGGFDRNGARGVRNLLNRFILNRLAPDLLMDGDKCRGRTLRIDYEVDDEQIDKQPFDAANLAYEWLDR